MTTQVVARTLFIFTQASVGGILGTYSCTMRFEFDEVNITIILHKNHQQNVFANTITALVPLGLSV